ncbi:MAG: VWA domain-containing protein [Bacilli bacterium]|nr:VWA domain-containing protein [Bacilli bacterium]
MDKIKHFIKNNFVAIIVSSFLLFLLIYSVSVSSFSFAAILKAMGIYTEEIKSVEFKSSDYDNPGSWYVEKSAIWIDKNKAKVTFDVKSILKTESKYRNVILVMDISDSMSGNKIEKAKDDSISLVNYLLDDSNNKVALITFDSTSEIISYFTNDCDSLVEKINNLAVKGNTNYNAALKNVDKVMQNYVGDNNDLIVLFLTDGYPNAETTSQVGTYESLKDKYSNMTINGVQYEMGVDVIDEIKQITDAQWVANQDTLRNVLFDAVLSPEGYKKFVITDYISDYFSIDSINDIKVTVGDVELNNDKIVWNLVDKTFTTGSDAKMDIVLSLKEQYQEVEGYYPTNKKESFIYQLENDNEKNVTSSETPVLKNIYDVVYDTNTPDDCILDSIPNEKYAQYSTVIKKDKELVCPGYLFKGWDFSGDDGLDIKIISNDAFVMPSHDVVIRATWTKQSIDKSMNGKVHEKTTLYKMIENQSNTVSYVKEYTGNHQDSLNVDGTEKIYYYKGNVEDNNVIFGGFCWKIIRTTDTGGVKLLYNGNASNTFTCDNSGSATRVGTSTFNVNWDSKSYVGYMHNKNYPANSKEQRQSVTLFSSSNINGTHYFSDEYEYNQSIAERYKLYDNPLTEEDERFTAEECLLNNNCNEILTGKYTLSSSNINNYNNTIKYIVGVSGEKIYYFELKNGQTLEDVNSTYYVGNSYSDNGDGTFTIIDDDAITEIKKVEWFNKYVSVKNKYVCINSNPCTNPIYITSSSATGYMNENVANNFIYANSFDYVLNNETGEYEYVLKDTEVSNKMQFWDWNYYSNKISKNHYTCFNTSGRCSKVYYIFNTSNSSIEYITLENGESVSDAINNMLYADDVNLNNSNIKNVVDAWYENNMTNYTKYIEDTIYCNDRSVSNLAGWNPNGGSTEGRIVFKFEKSSYKCNHDTDKFMVSNEKAKLKYPVGLLTASEASLGLGTYLQSGNRWWLMTPATCGWNMRACMSNINVNYVSNDYNYYNWDVRPVISLIPGIEYIEGNGTVNSPYIIDAN